MGNRVRGERIVILFGRLAGWDGGLPHFYKSLRAVIQKASQIQLKKSGEEVVVVVSGVEHGGKGDFKTV